jgi:hypothetical protein
MTLPNLERKDLKIFANNAAAQDNIAVFGSLAAANPQFSKDIEAVQSLPAFLLGWDGAITGNSSPALEDMNALFYVLFYQMAYLFQKGIAQWKATTDYYKGSFTTDGNGALYVSIVDNNVGNDPATDDGTHWNNFPTPAEVNSKVSKSGDTMTGALKMSGTNEVRFGTDDNFYVVKKEEGTNNLLLFGNGNTGLFLDSGKTYAPHYWNGTQSFRLLTTADLGSSTIGETLAPDYSAAVTLTNNTVYTAPANGWIMGYASQADYSSYSLIVNNITFLYGGRKSYNTGGALCFFIGKGQTVLPRADYVLRFVPCIGS